MQCLCACATNGLQNGLPNRTSKALRGLKPGLKRLANVISGEGGVGGVIAECGRRTGVSKDEDGQDLPKFDSFDGSVVGFVDFSRVQILHKAAL